MDHTTLNGDPEHHYPGCVNISFAYVEGESLLMALKDIALSSGSACTSASLEPSYVLHALGSSDESAHSSIRFGIGRFTSDAEIDYVRDTAEWIARCVARVLACDPEASADEVTAMVLDMSRRGRWRLMKPEIVGEQLAWKPSIPAR